MSGTTWGRIPGIFIGLGGMIGFTPIGLLLVCNQGNFLSPNAGKLGEIENNIKRN